jgi:DNA-directed RNA polymerase specialized sigma24 family protein
MRVFDMRAAPGPSAPAHAIANRPDESFDAFYRGQIDAIYRALAVVLADRELAREAADEAMVRAYASWSRVATYDNPAGWVFRVGLNWATSRRRRSRREVPLNQYIGAAVDPPDPTTVQALAALGRLSLAQRAVVVCRVLLDLSTTDTAEALGIAVGTVKSRLARALAELRTDLEEGDAR